MSPIQTSDSHFTFAQPPPGFFNGSAPRSGIPSIAEQDPMLLHHLANVSRTKLDNLFRSRKDSGLLKHVLIHNLSRSYEELVPEVVTEEREDGYDEILIQHQLQRTAEEMWFDSCLQDLEDDDEVDDDDDDDDSMYTSESHYSPHDQYYYTTDSTDDLGSPPALSPDMPSLDESEIDMDEDDGLTTPPLMNYIELRKRQELITFQRELEEMGEMKCWNNWRYINE